MTFGAGAGRGVGGEGGGSRGVGESRAKLDGLDCGDTWRKESSKRRKRYLQASARK